MTNRFFVVVVTLGLIGVSLLGQSKPSIQGVWKKVEVTVTNPNPNAANAFTKGTHTDVQPGLVIFTAKHYSNINDTGAKSRPTAAFKVQGKPTAEEMQAQWGPFQASSGTYEIAGTTLTLRPIVAKVPTFQSGGHARYTMKLDGNNLWLTAVELSTTPNLAANQPTTK